MQRLGHPDLLSSAAINQRKNEDIETQILVLSGKRALGKHVCAHLAHGLAEDKKTHKVGPWGKLGEGSVLSPELMMAGRGLTLSSS